MFGKLLLLLCVALPGVAAFGAISFEISGSLSGTTTQWKLVGADTPFTVSQFNPTGLQSEVILLPKSAFSFDYAKTFTLTFDAPLGRITNLTTGQSVALTRITWFPHLNELQLGGGMLERSVGDQYRITDFSTASIGIPLAELTQDRPTSYYQAGAWHSDSQINITTFAVPEPSTGMLLAGAAAVAFFRARRGGVRGRSRR